MRIRALLRGYAEIGKALQRQLQWIPLRSRVALTCV